MITEKEQKIVDAVNHYHGKYNSYHERHDAIVFCDRLLWGFSISGKCSNEVCTIEEFNQCVKEMVETSDKESRLGYLANRSLLTKESSDCSYYEKESKVSEDKPVYTQAMKDAGKLPSVGMKFICDDNTADSRISDFYGKELSVIGICIVESKTVITFKHYNFGIGCGVFNECWVKPIDTRTPEQKQVDVVVNDIMIASILNYEEAKRTALWLQERKLLAEIK